jgi:outer membrane receptor for ferrienterochelin and colicins
VRLRASVARGFRAPSFKELGWSFGNVSAGYVVNGNPDLQPESSWSYDAAVAWSVARDVVLEVEGFRNDVQNLIDFSTTGTNGQGFLVFQPVNIGRARTQGVESAVRWNPRAWSLSLGYTWLDARNLNDDLPLNRRAAHTGRFRATRSWALLQGFRADVTGLYTSEAPLVDETDSGLGVVGEQAAFLQWNLGFQLGVTPLLDLSAGVDNLFDQRPAGWTGLIQRRVWVGVGTRIGG